MTEPNHQPRNQIANLKHRYKNANVSKVPNLKILKRRKNVKVGGEPLAIEHQYLVTKDGSSVLMSRDDIIAMTSCSVLIWNSAVIESLIFDVKQQQTMLKESASQDVDMGDLIEEPLDMDDCCAFADVDGDHLLYEEIPDNLKFSSFLVPEPLE